MVTLLPLAVVGLVGTGTIGLILAFGSWETGAVVADGEIVWCDSSLGSLLGRCSVAGEFSTPPFIIFC